MPTLTSRLLRHHQPSSSPDDLCIDGQAKEYYRRSFDEPGFGSGHETEYSHLPVLAHQPAQRSESLVRNGKSHNRSRSHPFPSFFGTGRKRGDSLNSKAKATQVLISENEDDDDDDYAPQLDGSSSPGRRKNVPMDSRRLEERDTETERCMTCDSIAKCPKVIKTFKCATCLTVNDLERWKRRSSSRGQYDEPKVREPGMSRSHTLRKRESV